MERTIERAAPSPKEKEDIINWIKYMESPATNYPQYSPCPFPDKMKYCSLHDEEHHFCLKFFPETEPESFALALKIRPCYACPCGSFGTKYVMKVAKELVDQQDTQQTSLKEA